MRAGALAAVSLVSAVFGGLAVLLAAALLGWPDDESEPIVVTAATLPAEREPAAPAAVRSEARPLTGSGFSPARIYDTRSAGVVTVFALFGEHGAGGATSQGSGFVVSPTGTILTNAHVITTAGERDATSEATPAQEVYVECEDRERVPAKIVGWDLFDDVGVIQVDPTQHELVPVPLGDSSRVDVGEPVAAIGSPFGAENSLAVGVVSATRRSIPALTSDYRIVDAIQIDAPINRGNSGGPLFDARGRVIGINAQIRSQSGNAEGVGFAVPVNAAKRSLAQLLRRGRVAYAYVGISTDDLTPSLARRLGLRVQRGALVVQVNRGPGRRAGLRGASESIFFHGREVSTGGDVIVAVNGEPVRTGDDVIRIVAERLVPGQRATFSIVRGSRRLEVPVRLAERPLDPDG